MIALDTETTGVDFVHGCRPFFVGCISDSEELSYWHWRVNPYTRVPTILQEDLEEITDLIQQHGQVVFHNAKFDIRALKSVGIDIPHLIGWENIEDTLIYSHLYDSKGSHGLKPLSENILGMSIEDEKVLKKAVSDCRTLMGPKQWAKAQKGHCHFPTLKGTSWWKMDMWMPKEVAIHFGYSDDHPYHTVLQEYGLLDPIRTLMLWRYFKEQMEIPF